MDGGIADNLFEVRGVLQGIADATDRSAVFLTEASFRHLLAFPKGAHQLIVRRPADAALDATADGVRALAPHLDVRTDVEKLTVEHETPFPYQVDGDALGETTRLEFVHVPEAVKLVFPSAG